MNKVNLVLRKQAKEILWSLFLGINSAVYLSSNPKNNADVFLTPKNNAYMYFFNPKNNPQFEQPSPKKTTTICPVSDPKK